jgi:hypothetical protein
MNNKTKIYLGIGVLALATYYFWNKSKSTKANAAGKGNVPCAFLEGSELIYTTQMCV